VYYNLLEMASGAEINGKLVHSAESAKATDSKSPKAPREVKGGIGADAT
jgi:hypothetical protein